MSRWANFVYQVHMVNDDALGNIAITATMGTGAEMKDIHGRLFNGDTANRIGQVYIDDGTNTDNAERITNILGAENEATINAGRSISFPYGQDGPDGSNGSTGLPSAGFRISGPLVLYARVQAVAVDEDADIALMGRVRGGVPTITESANGASPIITVQFEQVV